MRLTVEDIQKCLDNENAQEAIDVSLRILEEDKTNDRVYYLLGNAYRKMGDWQNAINNYLQAMELNPESPARQAYEMANDILNFFNKDMYNQ